MSRNLNLYDEYTEFVRWLLRSEMDYMQHYIERVTMQTFNCFDVGNGSLESEKAEQFYHGFILVLIADLNHTHLVTSNRECGFGRYDVSIEPFEE